MTKVVDTYLLLFSLKFTHLYIAIHITAFHISTQNSKSLKGKQVAFGAEIIAIEETLKWYHDSSLQHLVIHSDSRSAIARASHSGAGPGQRLAKAIRTILCALEQEGRTPGIQWVKGHARTRGNECADLLAGKAAENTAF
jgi:ribonuclease HI